MCVDGVVLGGLPTELGGLTDLEYFDVYENSLTGRAMKQGERECVCGGVNVYFLLTCGDVMCVSMVWC